MTPLGAGATLTDVGFAVCTALEWAGERAVLCGGSAATYYAPEAYQSRDLDFVLRLGTRAKTVADALRPLGYVRAPEGLYRHPEVLYTVEFPMGPWALPCSRPAWASSRALGAAGVIARLRSRPAPEKI